LFSVALGDMVDFDGHFHSNWCAKIEKITQIVAINQKSRTFAASLDHPNLSFRRANALIYGRT
jgi:hypothetical protein